MLTSLEFKIVYNASMKEMSVKEALEVDVSWEILLAFNKIFVIKMESLCS